MSLPRGPSNPFPFDFKSKWKFEGLHLPMDAFSCKHGFLFDQKAALQGPQHKIVQKCESGVIFIEFQAENARGVVLFESRPKRAETARGVTKKRSPPKKNVRPKSQF